MLFCVSFLRSQTCSFFILFFSSSNSATETTPPLMTFVVVARLVSVVLAPTLGDGRRIHPPRYALFEPERERLSLPSYHLVLCLHVYRDDEPRGRFSLRLPRFACCRRPEGVVVVGRGRGLIFIHQGQRPQNLHRAVVG